MGEDGIRTWAVGAEIGGKYALVRLLGEGSAGTVFEAENTWTGRRVALKLLHPALSARPDMVARFAQEARIATRIAHPNIVEVLDLGREDPDGALYIVQELLRGEDLRAWLANRGAVDPRAAVAVATPVAAALGAMHACGVLHRDVKPENIFLTRADDGRVVPKLIDFGISKVLDPGAASGLQTGIGRVLGTPDYMAPEQIRGGEAIDARVDVWGLGVVLYEMLTGRCPYQAETVNLLILKIATEAPPRIEALAPGIPPALADLVHAALETTPARRLPSMAAMVERLAACDAALRSPAAAPPARLPATLPPPPDAPDGVATLPPPPEPPATRSTQRFREAPVPAAQPVLVALGDDDPQALRRASPVERLLLEGRLALAAKRAAATLDVSPPDGADVGRLRYVQAVAHGWLGDAERAAACAAEALNRLPRGDPRWFLALGEVAAACDARAEPERLVALASALREAWAGALTPARGVAAARLSVQLTRAAWPELAAEVLATLDDATEQDVLQHPLVRAWRLKARAALAHFEGDPARVLRLTEQTAEAFDEADDGCNACAQRVEVGRAQRELGAFDDAERTLRSARECAKRLGLGVAIAAQVELAQVLARKGADGAYALLVEALEAAVAHGHYRVEAVARTYLAAVLGARREHALAEREARAALDLPSLSALVRVRAFAALADALAGQRRWPEALDAAERAMARLEALGGLDEGELAVRATYARALDGCGHRDAACAAVVEAMGRLRARAAHIANPSQREAYWEGLPEHRLLLALVLAWQVDDDGGAG